MGRHLTSKQPLGPTQKRATRPSRSGDAGYSRGSAIAAEVAGVRVGGVEDPLWLREAGDVE
jgi:hypothetical protein